MVVFSLVYISLLQSNQRHESASAYSIDVHIDTRQDSLFVITPGVTTYDILA
jgi:hypothetical protein